MKKKFIFGFTTMLVMLLGLQHPLSALSCHKKWDYIICGGGNSAAVVANKLTAAGKSVLVIEAGANHDSDPLITNPQFASQLPTKYACLYDWQQTTLFQPNANSEQPLYTNGRILGGGSSHNGVQYVRPTNNMLNQWEAISGSATWGPANVNANFTQLENYGGTLNSGDIRGTSGPVQVRQAPAVPTSPAFAMETGITTVNQPAYDVSPVNPYPNDYNDSNIPIGVCPQWQLEEAINSPNTRQSSSIVFLEPIMIATKDPNVFKGIRGRKLSVLTQSFVDKVLFNSRKRAIGVQYIDDKGNQKKVYCKKEVIVSCGAFSCEVLMRSGIGNYSNPNAYTAPEQAPYALLSSLDIPKVFNNPNVGQNLRNHIGIGPVQITAPSELLPSTDLNALYVTPAFLPDPRIGTSSNVRSLQLVNANGANTAGNMLAKIQAILLAPKSVGSVVLQSRNPTTVSLVDPALFANPDDLALITAYYQGQGDPGHISPLNGPGYNLIIYLTTLPAGQTWTLNSPPRSTFETIGSPSTPGTLQNWATSNVFFAYHYVGTCKMAPKSNGGVVNADCKVYGVKKLRVIDNSIIPIQPDGNTGSDAFLIGWIMGDRIAAGY